MPVLALILLAAAGLITVVSGIWMIVIAFQRHWAWGVALLAHVPLSLAISFLPKAANPAFSYALPVGPTQVLLQFSILEIALGAASLLLFLTFLVIAWPEAHRPFFWSLVAIPLVVMAGLTLTAAGKAPGSGLGFSFRPSTSPGTRSEAPQTEPGPPSAETPLPPRAAFRSKIPPRSAPEGMREQTPPGIFYILHRVSTVNSKGVQAADPGERVMLLERLPNKKLRVTTGNADFVVESWQVTDDLDLARELEKQDFVKRGGRL
jgi:hypothetical protein